MKRITDILFSSKTTIFLLIVLAIAMGTGTFVEDKYDTITSKELIYNTKWFELTFVLLALNFIGQINIYHMFRKEKIGGLMFHLAFVIMILGAGITRYFGYEGNMHIREGEESNILISSEQYLRVSVKDEDKEFKQDFPVNFGQYSKNKFETEISTEQNSKINIKCKEFIKNAIEDADENVAGGKDLFELILATENGRKRVFVEKGQSIDLGSFVISFENANVNNAIRVTEQDGLILINSPFEMNRTTMATQQSETIQKDTTIEFKERCVYNVNNTIFVFKKHFKKAVKKIISSDKPEDAGTNAVKLDISINGKNYEAPILFSSGQLAEGYDFTFDGLLFKIGYGKKEIELPFALHLNKFILERYAGSESPSSYASEVTVIDKKNNVTMDHRIFMNNVLDYGNYRFFQSSYDQDEKGTILSVNHDFWGTLVSYTGYILLAIGFIITLMNKHSRFLRLRKSIVEIRAERKALITTIALILGFTTLSLSQNVNLSGVVNANHADKFGHLITQAVDGRFEPINSMAYDVLHKVTKKDKFTIEGKGTLDAMQAFMDMIVEPEFWKQQKIIYIKEQSVRDAIGITSKEACFADFFDKEGKYKLQQIADEAFRKKPVDQNNFDKEIIKVDERVNVLMMVFQVSILKIFPDQDSPNNKWISWDEKGAVVPLKGVINVINDDLKLPSLNYTNLIQVYFEEVVKSVQTGDYTKSDKVLGYLSSVQRQGEINAYLPSESKVNAEVFYNKSQIFIVLKNFYAVLSMLLLLFAFIENVRTKKSKFVNITLNICIALLAVGFLYQTFGMALRCYLLGYAPWSNGYEALILVSWGTLLAGFSFVRYSRITLAATSLLAFFILMTASHSNYDPQLTNLTPVLKSYWLIIHVAVLTISYGFLGLGFILGIMNMFIYLFKTKENNERLDLLIFELTYINEMNLTIGLCLATIGTFLGGVWANESWGRYWGWDAKETWALVIVITYTLLLHLRFIPKLNGKYFFNVVSIFSFSSVLMTFFGVNYFLSKGMHSYGAGDHAIFPIWAWVAILSIIVLMLAAKMKEKTINKKLESGHGSDSN